MCVCVCVCVTERVFVYVWVCVTEGVCQTGEDHLPNHALPPERTGQESRVQRGGEGLRG